MHADLHTYIHTDRHTYVFLGCVLPAPRKRLSTASSHPRLLGSTAVVCWNAHQRLLLCRWGTGCGHRPSSGIGQGVGGAMWLSKLATDLWIYLGPWTVSGTESRDSSNSDPIWFCFLVIPINSLNGWLQVGYKIQSHLCVYAWDRDRSIDP